MKHKRTVIEYLLFKCIAFEILHLKIQLEQVGKKNTNKGNQLKKQIIVETVKVVN